MSEVEAPELKAFDELCNRSLEEFIRACQKIGGPLEGLAAMVKDAFEKHRDLLHYGFHNSEPPQDSVIMQRFLDAVKLIVDYKEYENDSKLVNHFATVSASIVALGWITVKPAPAPYVREMRESGEYYANRVLSNNRGETDHLDWVQKWNHILMDLENFVRKTFLTGFAWGAAANRKVSAPSMPPPPPPPPEFGDAYACGDGVREALLSDLNVGDSIVRNLRPVVRRDRVPASTTQVQPPNRPARAPTSGSVVKPAIVRPPKHALEGKKWVVEYFKDRKGITVNNEDMSESLNMYKCENSGLEVMRKINSVVIDACKKTVVFLEDVIAGVSLINCTQMEIQLQGSTPLVSLDNCDCIQIFVRPEARNMEVVSSKSTSCNICVFKPDGDYKELPVPEQIRSVIAQGGESLTSTVVEKY